MPGPKCFFVRGSKVKVAREHFYGTGRAGDTAKQLAAAEPDTMELQASSAAAPSPA